MLDVISLVLMGSVLVVVALGLFAGRGAGVGEVAVPGSSDLQPAPAVQPIGISQPARTRAAARALRPARHGHLPRISQPAPNAHPGFRIVVPTPDPDAVVLARARVDPHDTDAQQRLEGSWTDGGR